MSLLEAVCNSSTCVLPQYEAKITRLATRLRGLLRRKQNVLSWRVASRDMRERLADINAGKERVKLATDAALIGIELPSDIVIHYDLPESLRSGGTCGLLELIQSAVPALYG